ncbi:polyprenyl synthetase family protein [Sporosarcina cascadiensis]|uniref:polyprenyl synthetase family protein n=1 Tax=Sporosarcina cascadiensis TaxID=2660747 RepID=UPI00129BB826|nr:polyprenyl synthetase family protein [Sporosarcina cascadiensis]
MEKIKLMSLYTDFRKDVAYIEKELERSVQSSSPIVRQASLHLLKAGGKRIRPIFVILAAQFGNYSLNNASKVAVSLELIHMASLVHDDVIDDSDMRRGLETVKAKWNNRVAMYAGDFIFSRALTSIGGIEKESVHGILAETMLEICKGEIIQIDFQRQTDQNLRDYLQRIKRKTALLLASSCELGALSANADIETVRKLRRYGYFTGMAFQIVDDILDIISTDSQLGKPAGSDLLNGHITLPILYIKDDEEFKPYMEQAFTGNMPEEERQQMLQYIRQSSAIEKAQHVSDLYLAKALKELEGLSDGKSKKALIQIADFIGQRKY